MAVEIKSDKGSVPQEAPIVVDGVVAPEGEVKQNGSHIQFNNGWWKCMTDNLSPVEKTILQSLEEGRTSKQIAQDLRIGGNQFMVILDGVVDRFITLHIKPEMYVWIDSKL